MDEQKTETIDFDGIQVPIKRQSTHEIYIALQPPEASPYLVVPNNTKPDEIVAFVEHWLEVIRELRTDMLKRFSKSKSLKSRYQTGDVVYLLGRPFMLRVHPLSSTKKRTKSVRGRTKVKANFHPNISLIDLFVIHPGDYDQGRQAFLSFALPTFTRNARDLISQCMPRVFPDKHIPSAINSRPMNDRWVRIDQEKDAVWFSERLIPYPAECIVYAYLTEIIKVLAPDATEKDRLELLSKGLPDWKKWSALLTNPNSPYTNQ